MQLLTAAGIRAWDEYTIQHEPVTSIDLMERAATACVNWITTAFDAVTSFHIFCGKGNNGGDGLAIARLLLQQQFPVNVYILEFGSLGTADFQANLQLLKTSCAPLVFVQDASHFPELKEQDVIIDSLLGTGLNRPVEGVTAALIQHINSSGCPVIAIDVPSGLSSDQSGSGAAIIRATHTLSFQVPKLAFFMPENASFTGQVHILDIGLHPAYLQNLETGYEWIDHTLARQIYKSRDRFSHKGNFGHALLVAGSYGKMGAAVLAAKACLRSGVGLLTCHIPHCGYNIMQTAVAEAMVITDTDEDMLTDFSGNPADYTAVGIGPGIGKAVETRLILQKLLQQTGKPMVLDADALNIMGTNRSLYENIPEGSILTPHPKELERLTQKAAHGFERLELAKSFAMNYNVTMVVKGHFTTIITPAGKVYFNSTGNAGMATGGTGDVLTGMLTGLLAQGYDPVLAAILGVYLHGLAGDLAAKTFSEEAMIARDLITHFGKAYSILGQEN